MTRQYKMILVIFLLVVFGRAAETAFYVSVDGNDNWSGRSAELIDDDGPFATIDRAQLAIRNLKKNNLLTGPVTVYIRGGFYTLDRKILFLPQDSGTFEAPITYKAFGDEKVTFSASRKINGWRHSRDNKWVCEIPAVKEEGLNFRALFVNGERRYRARTPNEGYLYVKDPMEDDEWGFHHYRYQFGFYPGDLISHWRNLNDMQVVVLHFWSDAHCPIKEINPQTLTVKLATPAWRRFTAEHSARGARYFVDNVYEGLDRAGEWYLDRPLGKLYYLAHPDEDMKTAEVVVPTLDQIMIFKGNSMHGEFVEHITIDGLTLAHTDWALPPGDAGDHQGADTVPGAVFMDGTRHVSMQNCTIEHVGTYGIDIGLGCDHILIQKNNIRDAAAGGILVHGAHAGNDDRQKTHHISIIDNTLTQLGRIYYSAVGIWTMHVSESIIAHNKISDLFYTGISVGKEWGYRPSASYGNLIEFNHIENAGQNMLSDMGGIYTLGVSPGSVIRNNLVHDIATDGYGGWGIYTDEGSSGFLIEKNIVYNAKASSFHQHYGKNNIIRNNIFANARETQLERTRDEDHLSFDFQRNIVYWKDAQLLGKNWDGDTTHFNMQNNLYFRTDGEPIKFKKQSIKKWQKRGQDINSIFADPLFVDPQNSDFNLEENSPAFDLGFEPIDMTAVGPRVWPQDVRDITYFSDADSSQQPATYYDSGSDEKKPLLVGLHTWSGDYRQEASAAYAKWCMLKDWVFIHPNFRGPNNSPQATGSDIVVADILSAVEYAKENATIDDSRIYLIGSSGGGYTALQMAAKAPDVWTAVSVWVPISDLSEWHAESLARQNRYAAMIENSCGGAPGVSDRVDAEYFKRSPINFLHNAKDVPLDINAGIYDGHTGSVPVSHSLRAFNTVANPADVIDEQQINHIVKKAAVPSELQNECSDPYYGDNKVLFRRFSNDARVTIFDGGHECIPNAALHWLEKQSAK